MNTLLEKHLRCRVPIELVRAWLAEHIERAEASLPWLSSFVSAAKGALEDNDEDAVRLLAEASVCPPFGPYSCSHDEEPRLSREDIQ